MLVIIDKGIPFLEGVLDAYAQVRFLAPEDITPQAVKEADALIVRTRTHINRSLLEGSKVRFVATATIGFDHIDCDYCHQASIHWTSCPGCNAQAVCDYVEEVIDTMKPNKTKPTIGIIGYGNVGKKVAAMAEKKGYNILLSDPPLGIGTSLADIAPQCDILTFHTPLTRHGDHPTYHMCNAAVLQTCQPHTLIINAARGGVIDEKALLQHLNDNNQPTLHTAIDCWENEPNIHIPLLNKVDYATYHIAGYSVEGKKNASQMCLDAFCAFFSLPILSINKKAVPLHGDSQKGWIQRINDQLKKQPLAFEKLRKQYTLR